MRMTYSIQDTHIVDLRGPSNEVERMMESAANEADSKYFAPSGRFDWGTMWRIWYHNVGEDGLEAPERVKNVLELKEMIVPGTAGDPTSDQRWVRSSVPGVYVGRRYSIFSPSSQRYPRGDCPPVSDR